MHFKYVVYKLTFPNGKIYIGKDIGGEGHSLRYFGESSLIPTGIFARLSRFGLES